jgi:hypothetical protein
VFILCWFCGRLKCYFFFFFRFLNNKFEDSYTPTIEDFHRKLYRIRNEVHQLDILDTSGNHPFPAMRRLSFLTGKLSSLVGLIYRSLTCRNANFEAVFRLDSWTERELVWRKVIVEIELKVIAETET